MPLFTITYTMDSAAVNALGKAADDITTTVGDTMAMTEGVQQQITIAREDYEVARVNLDNLRESTRQDMEQLRGEINASDDRVQHLLDERDALHRENEVIERRYTDAQLRTARVRAIVDDLEARLVANEANMQQTTTDIADKQAEYMRLRQQLADTEIMIGRAEVRVNATDAANQKILRAAEVVEAKLADANTTLKQLKDTTTDELEDKKDLHAALKQDVRQTQAAITRLQAAILTAASEGVEITKKTQEDLDAAVKQAMALQAQVEVLKVEIQTQSQEAKRMTFSTGQIFTTISLGLRMARKTLQGLGKDVSRYLGYISNMFSHVATLAWQASALAHATGNPIMAALHASIAIMTGVQGAQVMIQAESMSEQMDRKEELMAGWTSG